MELIITYLYCYIQYLHMRIFIAGLIRRSVMEYKCSMKRLIAFYISKRKKALIIIALMIPLIFLLCLIFSLLYVMK